MDVTLRAEGKGPVVVEVLTTRMLSKLHVDLPPKLAT